MQTTMTRFRLIADRQLRTRRQSWKERLRNPPLLWRRIIVGIALALPGTIAGQIIALALPESWAMFSTLVGAALGCLGGLYIERK